MHAKCNILCGGKSQHTFNLTNYNQCPITFKNALQNFRKALESEWKVSLSHRCRLNVSFEEAEVCVEYPSREGWNVHSDPPDCIVS